ncbi:MAG: N-terminal phage integrase SAM-like domain-containing protein [Actinomycetota bacterium]|nr:N-terminal phage integrase SAM-like domain-containing protein [Actinomycetota bacterium]
MAQKTRHFDPKRDAERFLDAIRGDLAHDTYIDPAGGLIPFREYAEEWRAAQIHRRSTAEQAETYLRNHAYPTLGHRPLGVIRRSEIQGWVRRISATLAPGSVEVVYRWVATIFKAAVGDRLIPASPCIRIALPKPDQKECCRWSGPGRGHGQRRPKPLPGPHRLRRRHGPPTG